MLQYSAGDYPKKHINRWEHHTRGDSEAQDSLLSLCLRLNACASELAILRWFITDVLASKTMVRWFHSIISRGSIPNTSAICSNLTLKSLEHIAEVLGVDPRKILGRSE